MQKILLGFLMLTAFVGPSFADSQGSATGGTAATQSTMAGAVYNSGTITLSNGQQVALQVDINGNLKITGNIGTITAITTVGTITNPVGVKGADGSTVTSPSNPLNVLPGQPIGITPTDRTITSATGSSQTVMALNTSRHSLIVQNTSATTNCGINPTGGTAVIGGAGTLTLFPGGSYQPRVPTLTAVTAICTSGQSLYAEEN